MLDRRIAMGNQFLQRNVLSHEAASTVFDSEKLLEYQEELSEAAGLGAHAFSSFRCVANLK